MKKISCPNCGHNWRLGGRIKGRVTEEQKHEMLRIRRAVEAYFGVKLNGRRSVTQVYLRDIIAHLLRKRGYSFPQIGRQLQRDHSSVVTGENIRMAKRLVNPSFQQILRKLEGSIGDR